METSQSIEVGDIVQYVREPSHENALAEFYNVLLVVVAVDKYGSAGSYPIECRVLPIYEDLVRKRALEADQTLFLRIGLANDELVLVEKSTLTE